MKIHTSLHIFPDTGHHFHFVPFDEKQIQESTNLSDICLENTCPWFHVLASDGNCLPWIRARFTYRYNEASARNEVGVILAIESNLGTIQRGLVVQPKERITGEKARPHTEHRPSLSPYAHAELSDVPVGPQVICFKVDYYSQVDPMSKVEVELQLTWLVPAAHPIEVDLIVDFGNTRTVALAIEHNQAANGLLGQICRPIRFSSRSDECPFKEATLDTSDAMIDSWFILHEPLFANLEPHHEDPGSPYLQWVEETESEIVKQGVWPFEKYITRPAFRTLRIPHICVQLSPALLGLEASQVLTQLPVQAGGNFLLSSPKRYLWDNDLVGNLGQAGQTFWTMYLNRWNPAFSIAFNSTQPQMLPMLAGTVLRLHNEDGQDWALGNHDLALPPNERDTVAARPVSNPHQPAFPRSDGLTWAALTVIETAYRNIMSAEWRRSLGQPLVKRRLRTITVTFPSGWTGQELAAYRRKWQKAVDIFSLGHLRRRQLFSHKGGGDRPLLLMDLDEAVASQLPFVFSEIKRLGNNGENWIELVGRGRGADAKVRVMNIDIGGGTTDIAIIEYSDDLPGPGVQLVSNLLYRDSNTIAGDALVYRAIEGVLLPALAFGLDNNGLTVFCNLLSSTKREVAKWRRITRQIFIPIIYRWLQDLGNGCYQQPGTNLAPTPQNILGTTVDNLIQEFRGFCSSVGLPYTILDPSSPLNYDQRKLTSCINETFSELFHSLAKAVDAFDCDLVFVSGKPSELPPLRPLLEKSLPLLPNRIVFAKDAQVGSWYPLSSDGKINDAKTATVAGAALNQAIRNGLIPQWQIKRRISSHVAKRNYWGLMPQTGRGDFGRVFLEPQDDNKTCLMMIGSHIGRRLLPSKARPEPVYKLRWSDPARYQRGHAQVNATLQVSLRRITPKDVDNSGSSGDQILVAEHLEITAVQGDYDDNPVLPTDVELRLCTMDSDEYWMDACIFHPEFP